MQKDAGLSPGSKKMIVGHDKDGSGKGVTVSRNHKDRWMSKWEC